MKLEQMKVNESLFAYKQIRSLIFIYHLVDEQKNQLQSLNHMEHEVETIKLIRAISAEIYSGCEILNQLLIASYRRDDKYRGSELKRGFNDNFKTVFKASKSQTGIISPVYKDEFLWKFFLKAEEWYVDIHDIRTQETHYDVGTIKEIGRDICYINKNRNGTSKNIYSNPSEDIIITIEYFLQLIDRFLMTEEIIADYVSKIIKN